jgi:two-component system, NarL family, sensor histidine kinase EvgS
MIDRALDTVPAHEQSRLLRRWVAVDLTPPFPWRRWLPLMLVSGAALLLLAGATVVWTRRLARESEARRRVVDRLNDIGGAMPAVCFRYVFDDERRLVDAYHSPNTAAFFGVEVPARGTLMPALRGHLAPADAEAIEDASREGLRSLLPGSRTATYHHPDGRTLRIRFDAVYSAPEPGRHAWTGAATDVSAEHALRDQLEAEARERHVLLASASHELRAPTHTLSLALQSLPGSALDGDAAGKLQIARDATKTLTLLLDDVLDAARVTAGAVELRPQSMDLGDLVDRLAAEHGAAAAAKGLSLHASVGPAVPQLVHADPLRLRQVLTNLLSNAVKYTERGEVRFEVDRCDGLRFTVTDTGIGLSDAQRRRLFEPFAASAAAPGTPSTGLGLAVCKRLAQLMGGSITLDRGAGGGTVATLQVPLVEPAAARGAASAPAGRRLLVCDDDPVSRLLLAEMLRAQGHDVIEAGSVAQALEQWRTGAIGLVITDLNMPGPGGAELMGALRAGPEPRVPVVVCSGDVPPAASGAEPAWDAWLAKPVDVALLSRTLLRFGFAGPAQPQGAAATVSPAA